MPVVKCCCFRSKFFFWLSGQRFNDKYKVLGIKYKVRCRNAEAVSRTEVGVGGIDMELGIMYQIRPVRLKVGFD